MELTRHRILRSPLEEHMLTKYVSFGNIPGTHVGFAYTPFPPKSFAKQNSLRKPGFGFTQPSRC